MYQNNLKFKKLSRIKLFKKNCFLNISTSSKSGEELIVVLIVVLIMVLIVVLNILVQINIFNI